MALKEITDKITSIGQLDNLADIRTQLAELTEELTPDYNRLTTLETENTTLKTENEDLQKANMKLFLKVQEQKTPEDIKKSNTGLETTPPVKRKFENLFTEKGAIK